MRQAGARRLGVIVAALLVASFAFPAPHAAAAVVTADALVVDSVDEPVGGGVRTVLTDADAAFGMPPGGWPGGVQVGVDNSTSSWHFEFLPAQGETLHVGHYANAGVNYPTTPWLRVSNYFTAACNSKIASFTIHQLDRDGAGNPVAIAATFEYTCGDGEGFGTLVGLVRVNSDLPLALLSSPPANRVFGNVTTGESTGPRSFTIEALGELPVDVESLDVVGRDAGDFPLDADTCSGSTLETGETCTFDITFEPTLIGDREATLVIGNDAPQGARILPMRGYGRIPTTTSVHVEPDTIYYPPGLKLVGTVTPAAGGNIECWYDDVLLVQCYQPREVGTHTFYARYLGMYSHGDSTSPVLTFEISSVTHLDLQATPTTLPPGRPVTFTFSVGTASNLLYPGGSVVLRDVTANKVLATRPIDRESSTHVVTASFAAGTHTITATYEGVSGVLDASTDTVTITVRPDTTAPTATDPKDSALLGSVVSPTDGLYVRLTWTGADNLSGIARYQLERQTDGGAWSSPTNVTSTSFTANLSRNHRYRFRIRPIDFAGNVGAWRYGTAFTLERRADYWPLVRYTPSWKKVVGGALWWTGTAMTSSSSTAKARVTVTSRSVAWVSLLGPNRGRAAIYVNGKYAATVDLYRATQQAQVVVWTKTWTTSARRTIEIRVLKTPGRQRVDVDGFWYTH